jgi:hypothetical protein
VVLVLGTLLPGGRDRHQPSQKYSIRYGEHGGKWERWREFLLAGDAREEEVRRGDWAVGDAAFRQRLHQLHGRPALRGRDRPRKQAAWVGPFPPKG